MNRVSPLRLRVRRYEQLLIMQEMLKADGKIEVAARALGVTRTTIYRAMAHADEAAPIDARRAAYLRVFKS